MDYLPSIPFDILMEDSDTGSRIHIQAEVALTVSPFDHSDAKFVVTTDFTELREEIHRVQLARELSHPRDMEPDA